MTSLAEATLRRAVIASRSVPMPPRVVPTIVRRKPIVTPRDNILFIVEKTADAFNVFAADVLSTDRQKKLIPPRHIAMYLCHTLARLSQSHIGRRFGRDSTTVNHAIRKMERLLDTDPEFAAQVAAIRISITLAGAET